MTTSPIDYAAEVRRTRLAQGLSPEIPKHIREAVAALLSVGITGGSKP